MLDKKTDNFKIVTNDYSDYNHLVLDLYMEKKLLILGLLLSHEMHGYQLNDLLKQGPGNPISLKKSNAYRLLSTMEKDGWVTYVEEQAGNRPLRRIYAVTETGKSAFFKLLRKNIATHINPEFPSLVGLDFLYLLPTDEVIRLLKNRLETINDKYQQFTEIPEDIRENHPAIEYLYNFYAYETNWLTEYINRLEESKTI